jgi:WD40 repeat protein
MCNLTRISVKNITLPLLVILTIYLLVGRNVFVQAQSPQQETTLGVNAVTVEWSPDGTLIAVGTESGVVIYDTNLRPVTALPGYTEQVISLSWSPDSQRLAGIGYPYEYDITFLYVPVITSSLLVWQRDINNNFSLEKRIDYPNQNNVVQVEWSPNPNEAMLAVRESEYLPNEDLAFGSITVWDTTNWEIESTLQNTYREMYGNLAWKPDGTLLAGGGEAWCYELRPCNIASESVVGNIIFVINPSTGQRIYFDYQGGQVQGISWSTNNQIAIIAIGIRVYDSTLTTIIGETTGYRQYGLKWMPSQTELLLWSRNGEINIVDTSNFESRFNLIIPDFQDLSLSSDGHQIVVLTDAQMIALYDIPLNGITCHLTIPATDTRALLTAIISANTTPESDTFCLEAGTYTLDAPITSDITLHGLGAGAEIIGSLQVSGAGRLTLRNVTVTP